MMRKIRLRFLVVAIIFAISVNFAGCASLKRKFIRKKKEEPRMPVYYHVKKYDIKPSMDLYEKHYVFWVNWHKKLVAELGESFKSDMRCMEEIRSNLADMIALLVDEKASVLESHTDELEKAVAIIEKRNLTKANETRIRHILEREYRAIRGDFSPSDVADYIRKEWK